jgi:hypothetical protein
MVADPKRGRVLDSLSRAQDSGLHYRWIRMPSEGLDPTLDCFFWLTHFVVQLAQLK